VGRRRRERDGVFSFLFLFCCFIRLLTLSFSSPLFSSPIRYAYFLGDGPLLAVLVVAQLLYGVGFSATSVRMEKFFKKKVFFLSLFLSLFLSPPLRSKNQKLSLSLDRPRA